jgi:FAD/FMN-containing dehydrogenase
MSDVADSARRRWLQAGAAGACVLATGCSSQAADAPVVVDAGGFETTPVARIARPASTNEVADLVAAWPGTLSIGGGYYSMGGQTAAPASLHLDLRGLDRLLRLDPVARVVRAGAGMRWRALLDHLDPHDLSVAIMQSYSNFTLGGSLSVNCHGRYVGKGPIVNSIRALQLVDADGRIHELSRTLRPEWFAAVIGGYGGLGVVTEVELDLDTNTPMRREVAFVPLAEYPQWFATQVLADPSMLMHNADLVPPEFDQPLAISWRRTDETPTLARRLVPEDADYGRDQALIWAATELPGGQRLRQRMRENQATADAQPIVWRNHEASLDVDALEPATRLLSTYVLQEYFVPVTTFGAFARGMARILRAHDADVLNVSIRHTPEDRTSLMRWATCDVFCFVLYLKQRRHARAEGRVRDWTRLLIDLALDLGGSYYLPYRPHATRAQFRRAYPQYRRFLALKSAVDPANRFRNRMWDAYLAD